MTLVDATVADPDLRGVMAVGRALHPAMRFIVVLPFDDGYTAELVIGLAPFACLRLPCSVGELTYAIRLAQRRAIVPGRAGSVRVGEAERPRRTESVPAPGQGSWSAADSIGWDAAGSAKV